MALDKKKAKRVAYQAAAAAALAAALWFIASNTAANLHARHISSGFGFLGREAGFEIGERFLVAYDSAGSYLRALAVGLANTFKVALLGVVLATALGALVGLGRLSRGPELRTACAAYVEFVRNVPLLVQLLFWYTLFTQLPPPDRALEPLHGFFLTNRGIYFPLPGSAPALGRFNFSGGGSVSPEFAALLVGLVLYTAAFVAEIVRAAILSVPRGQAEAGAALGLRDPQVFRSVVLPQALRAMLPPLTSQYLNLVKNSSLAVAIGYPDLVSIANTTINQTGQAIEGVAIIMAVYLTISLSIALLMNAYNARVMRR